VAADRPSGGFSVNDCEKISRFLSKRLDELDPVKEKYFLEVTSPGAERVFKHESDFIRFKGHRVNVILNQMFDGQKLITGKLLAKENDVLRMIDEATGEEIELSMDRIKRVKNILEV
jgi:ribosome maturation factor RimP